MSATAESVPRPLGVYVHFPFCASRCPYCDFATEARAEPPHAPYADAVIAELAARAPPAAGHALRSIYFGGGTPGRWAVAEVARVTAAIHAALPGPAPGLEVTLEANPDDVTPAGVAALLEAGVNRLSLGVQSLDDRELALLGRRADRATTLRALQAVRAAGCDNLSCDLMFALPGQTLTRLGETLDEVMALGPEHVSAYGLTVEDGTPFGVARRAGTLTLPAEGLGADMFELVCERLGAAGYEHYEISNFARPGRAAVHNTLYWVGSEYLGLGAAAHSMRFLDGGSPPARIERRANVRSPEAYLAAARGGRHEPGEREELDLAAQRREGLWLWLRLVAGVDRDAFARRYGVDPAAVDPEATAGLERQGLLAVTPARLQLTRRGVLFADEVALAFL